MNGVNPTTTGIKPAQNGLGDGVSQKHRLIESVFSKETMDRHVSAARQSEADELKKTFLARTVGETDPTQLEGTLQACALSRGLTVEDISATLGNKRGGDTLSSETRTFPDDFAKFGGEPTEYVDEPDDGFWEWEGQFEGCGLKETHEALQDKANLARIREVSKKAQELKRLAESRK